MINNDDHKVKNFKTDGWNEYKSKKVNKYCEEDGIFKSVSPSYVHEINGKAERINQTIQNSEKTLLHWAGLSENFWNFAATYAYICNKIPYQRNNNLIFDEVFYGIEADIKYLKMFGCKCHFRDYSQNKSKFSNTREGIFLGFIEKYYAYIVMEILGNIRVWSLLLFR